MSSIFPGLVKIGIAKRQRIKNDNNLGRQLNKTTPIIKDVMSRFIKSPTQIELQYERALE